MRGAAGSLSTCLRRPTEIITEMTEMNPKVYFLTLYAKTPHRSLNKASQLFEAKI